MIRQHLINITSKFLPPTRFFPLKLCLYQSIGIKVGRDVKFGNDIFCSVLGNFEIGNDVWIGRGCDFNVPTGSLLTLGSNIDIGPNVKFLLGSHQLGDKSRRAGDGIAKEIRVGSGSWIGASSLILGGVTIGRGSVVAAGSVVIEGDYPDNVLLAGVPARIVRFLGDAGE